MNEFEEKIGTFLDSLLRHVEAMKGRILNPSGRCRACGEDMGRTDRQVCEHCYWTRAEK